MDNVNDRTMIEAWVPNWIAPLYGRGYTVSEAARAIGCSNTHLRWFLMGKREFSAELTEKLNALPKKKLMLRLG